MRPRRREDPREYVTRIRQGIQRRIEAAQSIYNWLGFEVVYLHPQDGVLMEVQHAECERVGGILGPQSGGTNQTHPPLD
jgi:hypothetical protein